jgi:hypothetical protein
MPRAVWLNPIEEAAFREKTCRTCFEPNEALQRITGDGNGCPHLAHAALGKLPKPWTLRRNATMGDTYRCEARMAKPAVARRGIATADTAPMLDIDEGEYLLVPVDGWPDYKAEAKRQKDGDHQ